ncbi:MAG: AsmA family protein, partial [Alphaproteobacteria bacterium]|nr:AsmA family protein [Alphaproteobacteria bacterium]
MCGRPCSAAVGASHVAEKIMRLRTVATVVVVLIAALAVTAVAVVTNMDFGPYKGLIEAKAKEATGRDLKIGGEFKVMVGLSPALAVSDVSFANAPWGSRPQMVTARRFEAQVDLIPLLSGTIRVRRLVLLDPDILLETDARGRGNWEFAAAAAPASTPQPARDSGKLALPQVNALEIRNAKLVYRDGQTRKSHTVALARALLKADSEQAPLTLDIDGMADNIKLQVSGEVGSIAALGSPGTAFPVKLTARVPDVVSLRVEGQATEPLSGKGYDLRINAEAGEIAKLAALADVKLPALGPLKSTLRLTEANGRPTLPELNVEAGRRDLVLAKIVGAAGDPAQFRGLALDVSVEGNEIGSLSGLQIPALPRPLPPVPALGPFRLAARIAEENNRISLPSVNAELGRSDLLRLTVQGAMRDPLERQGFSLAVAGEAKDLQAVAKVLKTDTPWEGPLSLSVRVSDAGPNRYALGNLRLAAAGSDLGGEGTVSLAGERPALAANLASTTIDLAKLLPAGGAKTPPPAAPSGVSSRPAAGQPKGDGRLFPADPLPFELLQTADAELRYRADAIRLPSGPLLRQTALQISLRNGELNLRPFASELAQGRLGGEASLSARSGATALKFQTRGLDLGALDKEIPGDDLVTGGKTDIDLDLRGSGRSLRAIAASLDGSLFLHTGAGSFASRYSDMLGLGDLIEVISRSLPRQERTPLNCVVARLDLQGGVAAIRALVADTQRLTLDGSGRLDLRSEQPDILLNTSTKVVSLLSLLPPIRVGGTLANPSFVPDVGA